MINVYIGRLLDLSYLPLLYPNLGIKIKDSNPFMRNAFKHYKSPVLKIVDDVKEADYILIPHNYFLINNNEEYLNGLTALSKKYNKRIIIFAHGDSTADINIPNSVIFRTSRYKSELSDNEIIMPAYVEDLADYAEFKYRNKDHKLPVIGFCGWAGSNTLKSAMKYWIRNIIFDLKSLVTTNPIYNTRKKGMWFRRKAIKILSNSKIIENNFIIRKSFSGHKSTIEMPTEQARREYIDNIKNSDFTLTLKGDGNFSFRFYEVISASRIPLFIDTDCSLPLENVIDYKSFVLFINDKDLNEADKLVVEFYNKINNEEFIAMQQKARDAFENFLRIDKFFEYMFLKEKIKDYI